MNATADPSTKIRKAFLRSDPAFDTHLFYYPPGLSQPEHDHGSSQFSILLAGSLVERVAGDEHRAGPGQVSAKPKGIVHSDAYGPHGAALLSFRFQCEATAQAVMEEKGWQWRISRDSGSALGRALKAGFGATDGGDFLWDLLSQAAPRMPDSRVPDWLRWVRSELDRGQGSDIGALAAQAGVHRVHLSRQFVRFFGMAPSAYRQRQMASRAVRALVDDRLPAAVAAQDSGFADQSHMARAIRAAFGATPGKIASLLNN